MRKMIMLSWIILLLMTGLAAWTWVNLPVLEQYPVHWNAQGTVDRYGSKTEVLFALAMMPITAAFTFALFVFIPKIEPIRANIEVNSRPYAYIWVFVMLLLTGVSGFISYSYTNIQAAADTAKFPISFLLIGMSVFFIFFGNIMGKFKRNFFVGLKTPWTLMSDLSWDKTHRLAGRMFVAVGLASLLSTFVTKPEISLYLLVGSSLVITVFSVVYSFVIWKNDPDKRT